LKFGRGQSKYLLIEAFKDILPEPIWNREKAGFVLPFEEWFNNMGLSAQIKTRSKPGAVGKLKWAQLWSLYLMKELRVGAPAA
jgi:asparagine synthase (glutamine-hydrolysing)